MSTLWYINYCNKATQRKKGRRKRGGREQGKEKKKKGSRTFIYTEYQWEYTLTVTGTGTLLKSTRTFAHISQM